MTSGGRDVPPATDPAATPAEATPAEEPAAASGAAPVLAGRRVVVVGGASGIGLATVRAAATAGAAAVAVLDADGAGAAHAADQVRHLGGTAYSRQVDVTVEVEVADAFGGVAAAWGGIDAVLHVAGIMQGQGLDVTGVPIELWHRVISVNLTGPFLVAKHAVPHLVAGTGVLVLVGSKAGVLTGSGSVPYGASKGGLHGLALTLDRQLRPRGVRVHALCPGDIDTPLMRRSLDEARANGVDAGRVAGIEADLGRPEDVASALVLLAAPLSASVTGTVHTG